MRNESMKKNAAAAFSQATVYIKANQRWCFQCPRGRMKVVATMYRGYNEDTRRLCLSVRLSGSRLAVREKMSVINKKAKIISAQDRARREVH